MVIVAIEHEPALLSDSEFCLEIKLTTKKHLYLFSRKNYTITIQSTTIQTIIKERKQRLEHQSAEAPPEDLYLTVREGVVSHYLKLKQITSSN